MRSLELREVEPLLAALADPSAETRLAVLDALTRLPLDRECWLALGRHLAPALDDRSAPEHLPAIELAGRVPLTSVRAHLCSLAAEGDPAERRRAAYALADAGDDRAVEPLVALLDEPEEAREARRHLDRLEASRGRGAALPAEGDEVESEETAAPAPGGPPPQAGSDALRLEVSSALDAVQLDFATSPAPGWQSSVREAVDRRSAQSDARTVWALMVSELFSRTAVGELSEAPGLAHEIALLTAGVDGFVPDVEGLLVAYRTLATRGPTGAIGAQVGWTAASGGLGFLLAALAPMLAVPGDRLYAARLVSEAAGLAGNAHPPAVEGPGLDPPPFPPRELIEDLPGANGAGENGDRPTRGLPPSKSPEPAEPEAAPRWILARVTEVGRPDDSLDTAFRADAAHEIAVAIGPEQEGMLAAVGSETFDDAVGEVGEDEQLFVTFIPPPSVSPPQTGSIFLPRHGTSRPCTFGVRVPGGLDRFEAQIQVYHANRMVQMALLHGPVAADPAAADGSRIELDLAVIRPGTTDLVDRPRFDAALSRTAAATTAVADDGLALFDNQRIDRVVPTLRQILTSVATSESSRSRRLEDAGVVDDLRALAFQGCELRGAIADPLGEQLGDPALERLQVLVESACDFFPVELVYDLPPPTQDAGLCPGWKEAVRTGRCAEPHLPEGPRGLAEHVCPMGFWALSKVIERHVVGDQTWRRMGLGGVEFAVRSCPTAERGSLEPPHVVLFAASNRVDGVQPGQIDRVRKTLARIAEEATYAETWDDWVEAVGRRRPSLLVLLSHTAEVQLQAALEVGAGDCCLISQVQPAYVSSSEEHRPVVLLLGCETAIADYGLQTFVAKFQDLGASLVVGTVASVLGQRAAPVAGMIATDIAAACRDRRPTSAGEFLRGIRRKLLARGELTALCLTAYGDADWQLGGA